MVALIELAGAISIIAIFVLASIIKSLRGGYLGNVVQNQRQQTDRVDKKLDDIRDLSQDTYDETERNGKHIDNLGEAVYLLHREDVNVDGEELRERLNVDSTGSDIFDRDKGTN